MESFIRFAAVLGVAALVAGCAAGGAADNAAAGAAGAAARAAAGEGTHAVGALRFIGEQTIAHKAQFDGTTVGGLSGVDYDARSGAWVFISDDRSYINPARFYRATLRFTAASFDAVTLTGVTFLKQADGTHYRSSAKPEGGVVADPESIRVDPRDGTIWYASEGDRKLGLDPFVRQAQADGALQGELPLPPMFAMHRDAERGVRNNLNIEGIAFAPDGDSLWAALESPLYEDGPIPTPDHGALARITRFDRAGRMLGQFAYPVDAIPARPGEGKAADNGVSEIVATGPHTVLVLERAAVQGADGKYRNFIRLYEADMRAATDVRAIPALGGAGVANRITPAAKRLLYDFTAPGLPPLDNMEGFTFGPRLPNGHDTLLFVTDDNFNRNQVTRMMLFEVLPR